MNRKLLTICIAIILTVLLAFNAQTVYSSPVPNSQQPSPAFISSDIKDSVSDNSTLPSVTNSQNTSFKAQQAFWTFLNQVAGIETTNYNVTKFQINEAKALGSQKTQTSISAIISNSQENLSIAMVLIEGKVRFYDLNLINGSLEGTALTVADSLNLARNAINKYQINFNASYCDGYDQLIPQTVQTDTTTIERENTVLTVQTYKNINDQMKYAELCWYNKIGNTINAAQSIQATVAKTGILTSFADNQGVYKIATTNVAITKENALSIAMAFINAYATENGRTIKAIDSQLTYVSDINGTRGDSFLLYPQWTISANLDESNANGIYGYVVLLWADSGAVRHQGVQGNYQPLLSNGFPQNYLTVVIIVTAISSVSIMAIAKKYNRTIKSIRIGGTIILVALICSLFLAQPASAIPSTVYGSTAQVFNQDELDRQADITSDISSMSSGVGYTTYNWYGSDTTADNLYIGAYDHGDGGSIVFYIGHGDDGTSSGDGYAIFDNSGNWVSANDIYDNSISQSSGHKKVAVIWSCHQGEQIATMPRAWLHTTSLSTDGYNSPDYSGQAYIGWNGLAPFISITLDNQDDAGYWFLYTFYYDALTLRFDLNTALNYAAQSVWQVNFGNCVLHTGTGDGNMVVFGQGTMYIGAEQWVSNTVYWAYGYSAASGVFNPYNIQGGQNDGQVTQLYAGNYGDYAWVTGYMNAEASGEIHLWAHSGSGYYSHLEVFVSEDYNNWYQTYNGYIDTSNPSDIYCGGSYGFRYIALCVYDDSGWSANMYIDAVHVISIWA
jgi:hypothetical protein